MEFQVNFKVNASIYVKNPETSELGRQIVKHAIDLIYSLGFEHFTIKKLAQDIGTTEATVYRYFENKHRILLYILNWYWSYMEFLMDYKLQNIASDKEKLKIVVDILTSELPESSGIFEYNKKALNEIVIAESSKVYLTKEVSEINKHEVFKPYKDLCSKISNVIREYNPNYQYPKSLSTTIVEVVHQQQFFGQNLPRLTDIQENNTATNRFTNQFILDLVLKVLG